RRARAEAGPGAPDPAPRGRLVAEPQADTAGRPAGRHHAVLDLAGGRGGRAARRAGRRQPHRGAPRL
ncbi:MAG: hypothetical protein GWN07_03715, partial [Actinobacteria bacterium]|nr:hypothetical protein [Actinomycetota bacterium]NIU64631.1 hypothetical protein [Actinomycetota bacterium]NIW26422.1 hypothetical protein [Actinomycetota bacterium]NIX18985.1 hypothetical protein [Actinomycetota bacterium]